MWIAGLSNLGNALPHLHIQANAQLPKGYINVDFMNLNQAVPGHRKHKHNQGPLKTGRKVVIGHFAEPAVITRVANWVCQ